MPPTSRGVKTQWLASDHSRGWSKVAAKALGAGKFSGFLPKAATTLELPWIIREAF